MNDNQLVSLMRGVTLSVSNGVLRIHAEPPLRALSSAVHGGGWSLASDVLNVHVDKGYHSDRPEDDLQAIARRAGVEGQFLGLMTAAYVENAGVASHEEGALKVVCVATAGVTNAMSAGRSLPSSGKPTVADPGTINVVLVVDANLTTAAMVNAVITATEAKTLALIEHGVRTTDGHVATGTSTDSIVIGCTGEGLEERYAGPATLIGHLIARCVSEAIGLSLDRAKTKG